MKDDWRTDVRKLKLSTWARAFGGRKIHLWHGKETLCGAKLSGHHHNAHNAWESGYRRCEECLRRYNEVVGDDDDDA